MCEFFTWDRSFYSRRHPANPQQFLGWFFALERCEYKFFSVGFGPNKLRARCVLAMRKKLDRRKTVLRVGRNTKFNTRYNMEKSSLRSMVATKKRTLHNCRFLLQQAAPSVRSYVGKTCFFRRSADDVSSMTSFSYRRFPRYSCESVRKCSSHLDINMILKRTLYFRTVAL